LGFIDELGANDELLGSLIGSPTFSFRREFSSDKSLTLTSASSLVWVSCLMVCFSSSLALVSSEILISYSLLV
jgi:hypothetical protein